MASDIARTTSADEAPGARIAATPASSSAGDVAFGDDPAHDDRDVEPLLAQQLDHRRNEREVGAGQHRQADRVDVLVDSRGRDPLGRLAQTRCRSPRSRHHAGSAPPP